MRLEGIANLCLAKNSQMVSSLEREPPRGAMHKRDIASAHRIPRLRNMTSLASLLFSAAASLSEAFVAPSRVGLCRPHAAATSLNSLPEFNTFLLSDGLSAATYMGGSEDLSSLYGPLSTLRTFFIVVAAAVFGITAIAYLTAAFLVPRAAEQLEQDTKRLRPELWDEYEAKLEEGESMVNRPDLLQELGKPSSPIKFTKVYAATTQSNTFAFQAT